MTAPRPHFSFWFFAAMGLFWNLMGCLNYLAQSNAASVARMPEAYQQIIANRPAWATAAFAVAVFGGAVGCILLLLRRRVASPVLLLSLIGIALTALNAAMTAGPQASTILALLVGGALYWYATIAARAGWLR